MSDENTPSVDNDESVQDETDEVEEQADEANSLDNEDKEKQSISADLIRGHINTIILRSLFDGDRYGYDIINEIEQKSHGQYTMKQPTLYSALKRLEAQGYVKAYWGGVSNGGRRRYFSLTEDGKNIVKQNQSEWEYSRTIIDNLISDEDYDFTKPAPQKLDFRILKSTTSRTPIVSEEEGEYIASNEITVKVDDFSSAKNVVNEQGELSPVIQTGEPVEKQDEQKSEEKPTEVAKEVTESLKEVNFKAVPLQSLEEEKAATPTPQNVIDQTPLQNVTMGATPLSAMNAVPPSPNANGMPTPYPVFFYPPMQGQNGQPYPVYPYPYPPYPYPVQPPVENAATTESVKTEQGEEHKEEKTETVSETPTEEAPQKDPIEKEPEEEEKTRRDYMPLYFTRTAEERNYKDILGSIYRMSTQPKEPVKEESAEKIEKTKKVEQPIEATIEPTFEEKIPPKRREKENQDPLPQPEIDFAEDFDYDKYMTTSRKFEHAPQDEQQKPVRNTVKDKLNSMNKINYQDLKEQAKADGLRLWVAGETKKKSSMPSDFFNKGYALVKASGIFFLFAMVELIFLIIFQGSLFESTGAAIGYTLGWAAYSLAIPAVCVVLYFKKYGAVSRRLKQPAPIEISALVFAGLFILLIAIILLAGVDVSATSTLLSWFIFPILFLLDIPIFGVSYYLFAKSKVTQ